MPYATLRYETDGPLAVLTLERPERLNAISREMVAELADVVAGLEADDDVRVRRVRRGPAHLRRDHGRRPQVLGAQQFRSVG